jgi:hypothetical protein
MNAWAMASLWAAPAIEGSMYTETVEFLIHPPPLAEGEFVDVQFCAEILKLVRKQRSAGSTDRNTIGLNDAAVFTG